MLHASGSELQGRKWLCMADFVCLSLLHSLGCGKSVTINVLTGMYAPTSGDALVYGASINREMSSVRKLLGVCPQHNTLFDLLTVREHLELYAAIKGVDPKEADKAIDAMIAEVGLTEKTNDRTVNLSGGMQRKLSVGIALLGDSKIIFLDESVRRASLRCAHDCLASPRCCCWLPDL